MTAYADRFPVLPSSPTHATQLAVASEPAAAAPAATTDTNNEGNALGNGARDFEK
jgi:hypothetical protein